jgi:RNA polymerase sigma-70 factor, ECF subfamily
MGAQPTLSAQPTDALLMREVQSGSQVALGKLYGRLAPPAYRTAMSVCHERACAEDAVQDAFVSLWVSRRSYHTERGTVAHWVMSIVRHRAIYLARHRSVVRVSAEITPLQTQAVVEDVPSALDARADSQRLRLLLARLPPAQRQVIELAFFDGLTHAQIAHRLNLPAGTVKGRMRLGFRKLRSEFDGQ